MQKARVDDCSKTVCTVPPEACAVPPTQKFSSPVPSRAEIHVNHIHAYLFNFESPASASASVAVYPTKLHIKHLSSEAVTEHRANIREAKNFIFLKKMKNFRSEEESFDGSQF